MAGFQSLVSSNLAPAVEGDFASTNPRKVVLAGPGGLIAGPEGVTVGRFAWVSSQYIDDNGAPAVVDNFASGGSQVAGFVHREQQGLIQTYLQEAGMVVPAGFGITLFDSGDFWAKNAGSGQALPGMKAYANLNDGKVTFAASGAPGSASGTASSVAAATSSVTGSIADNVLTVTAVGSGVVRPGTTISGTGVAAGTKIVEQLLPLIGAETLGGVGRYAVSIPEQVVASTTISGTYGILTVGGTVTGTFYSGAPISGSGVAAGTVITQLITGTGGAGTYAVDNNTVVGSTTISAGTTVETKWFARSAGLAGELVKISDQVFG